MSNGGKEHWQNVYSTKQVEQVSWFQSLPAPSLDALEKIAAGPSQSLIDIGGGASRLTAQLAEAGWRNLTVLDIAQTALDKAQQAAGEHGSSIEWIAADIAHWYPPRRYDIWHDRAVFHFLAEAPQRAAYKSALERGLRPGGWLIIATFAGDGPEKCSNLPVRRYDADDLAQEFGEGFELVESWREVHRTPFDTQQNFTWCCLRKRGG